MQRVIEEMAKAKNDVEKRYRDKLPQIIRECMAFAYLGKSFRFDANAELDNKVNQRLVELGDEILIDIETRAKRAIKYAEEEDDEATILAYMKREQDGEDLITRIDKHNSNFRYFLEGWMAIGIVNGLSQTDILSNIFRYMHNVYVSDLWNDAFKQGYLSDAIRTRGYRFGKGILRNPIDALSEIEKHSINEAFQYGRFLKFQKDGAIGYTIHRNSSFDCPYCDSFTGIVHPMDVCLLPLHPRCVCYSKPIYEKVDNSIPTPVSPKSQRENPVQQRTQFQIREGRYKSLLNNPNYEGVEFNIENSGLMARHIQHNLDKHKGIYELQVQRAGFKRGHEVILEKEGSNVIGEKFTEGTWDGNLFEIAGCETATSNNVLNGLRHCAKKKKTQIAVLNFPNGGFDKGILERTIKRYRGLEKLNDDQFLRFERIICVEGEEIIYDELF